MRPFPKLKDTVIKTNCFSEAASIDSELLEFITKQGFKESSYKNDTCPSYTLDHNFGERELRLFIDFDDKDMREIEGYGKYFLHYSIEGALTNLIEPINTDDTSEIKKGILQILESVTFVEGVQ